MSRFFSEKYRGLTPYTPGEQPAAAGAFVKLNTNESPFPPSEKALRWAAEHTRPLNLYPDPEYRELRAKLAELVEVGPENILPANGSDEVLNFAFLAFCDRNHSAAFPDITYGFYPVFAALNGVPYQEIPLRPGFRVQVSDYVGLGKTIFLANPNAPTGLALPVEEIEEIVRGNPDHVVVIDEAYIDFGGVSCVPLIREYDNLLVTRTFSKSRSMAGARLGFGVGCPALIADLNTVRYSTNPYNINSMTVAAALGTLADEAYTRANCAAIAETRDWTAAELRARGFDVTDSAANFLFARTNALDGGELYRALKEKKVLVRHFDKPAIGQYNRITIGARYQMSSFLRALDTVLEEHP